MCPRMCAKWSGSRRCALASMEHDRSRHPLTPGIIATRTYNVLFNTMSETCLMNAKERLCAQRLTSNCLYTPILSWDNTLRTPRFRTIYSFLLRNNVRRDETQRARERIRSLLEAVNTRSVAPAGSWLLHQLKTAAVLVTHREITYWLVTVTNVDLSVPKVLGVAKCWKVKMNIQSVCLNQRV